MGNKREARVSEIAKKGRRQRAKKTYEIDFVDEDRSFRLLDRIELINPNEENQSLPWKTRCVKESLRLTAVFSEEK